MICQQPWQYSVYALRRMDVWRMTPRKNSTILQNSISSCTATWTSDEKHELNVEASIKKSHEVALSYVPRKVVLGFGCYILIYFVIYWYCRCENVWTGLPSFFNIHKCWPSVAFNASRSSHITCPQLSSSLAVSHHLAMNPVFGLPQNTLQQSERSQNWKKFQTPKPWILPLTLGHALCVLHICRKTDIGRIKRSILYRNESLNVKYWHSSSVKCSWQTKFTWQK